MVNSPLHVPISSLILESPCAEAKRYTVRYLTTRVVTNSTSTLTFHSRMISPPHKPAPFLSMPRRDWDSKAYICAGSLTRVASVSHGRSIWSNFTKAEQYDGSGQCGSYVEAAQQ
jgi:hypothetical protein